VGSRDAPSLRQAHLHLALSATDGLRGRLALELEAPAKSDRQGNGSPGRGMGCVPNVGWMSVVSFDHDLIVRS
jgi:hypothetical protein